MKDRNEPYSKPFVPMRHNGNGLETDAALRIADALEYIAAQLGMIARASEEIERQLSHKTKSEAQHSS